MPDAASRVEHLPAEPASAGKARRFVTDTLRALELPDLVDVGALLVSEVVTNAVLHAGTEMVLRLEPTGKGARVEVTDGSPLTPSKRNYDDAADTGRGLGLVDALAAAWGVRPDGGGKTVWFELDSGEASPVSASSPRPRGAEETASALARADKGAATVPVRLERAPVRLLWATVQYGDALLREAALMAIGTSSTAASGRWQAPAVDLAPLLEELEAALDDGVAAADVVAAFPVECANAAVQRLAVIDEADRMAHEGLLLGAPALPEVAACRRWYLGEIARQLEGSAPRPWELPSETIPAPKTRSLGAVEREAVERLGGGAVVADDANRIVYVNEQAADLLGWSVAELTGQRLTVLIPPELKDAHLAGYTRYQVTGASRIIGTTIQAPALRRDGSVVEVQLRISVFGASSGRLFLGELRPVP